MSPNFCRVWLYKQVRRAHRKTEYNKDFCFSMSFLVSELTTKNNQPN
ncbi:hypothetical protein C5167_036167 [Papaver somniferum]|nr:hypothetical protein C5167_036167 [Papaver somniferum]